MCSVAQITTTPLFVEGFLAVQKDYCRQNSL
jgi:hypothetical protein